MLSHAIIKALDLKVSSARSVAGGDINKAFCISTDNGRYFLKVNDASAYPEMFNTEREGLQALRECGHVRVPQVIQCGTAAKHQFILLEWIDPGVPTQQAWEKFGSGLAMIHKTRREHFGWRSDNYIGSLAQSNKTNSSWSDFYGHQRIIPLVKRLRDTGSFSQEDVSSAESFCKSVGQLYPPEPPALLHGDLWSGNFMFDGTKSACVFDPAVYCGHREMDLAMTKLFGGFDERFYETYDAVYPLTKGWESRLRFSQLYPLLVHAILFGGSYVRQAVSIIKDFRKV